MRKTDTNIITAWFILNINDWRGEEVAVVVTDLLFCLVVTTPLSVSLHPLQTGLEFPNFASSCIPRNVVNHNNYCSHVTRTDKKICSIFSKKKFIT